MITQGLVDSEPTDTIVESVLARFPGLDADAIRTIVEQARARLERPSESTPDQASATPFDLGHRLGLESSGPLGQLGSATVAAIDALFSDADSPLPPLAAGRASGPAGGEGSGVRVPIEAAWSSATPLADLRFDWLGTSNVERAARSIDPSLLGTIAVAGCGGAYLLAGAARRKRPEPLPDLDLARAYE